MATKFYIQKVKEWSKVLKKTSLTLKTEINLMRKMTNEPLDIERKIEGSLMYLRKKVDAMNKKLQKLLDTNFKKIKEKKDPLTFMGKLRLKVKFLVDDADGFIKSIHKTDPFEDTDCYFEDYGGIYEDGNQHYMKETFNSKYKKHINEIQRSVSASKEKKNKKKLRKFKKRKQLFNSSYDCISSKASKRSKSRSVSSKKSISKKSKRRINRTREAKKLSRSDLKAKKRSKTKKKQLEKSRVEVTKLSDLKQDNKKLHDLVMMLTKEMGSLKEENRRLAMKVQKLEGR